MPKNDKTSSISPLDEAIASVEAGDLTAPISVEEYLAEVATYEKD